MIARSTENLEHDPVSSRERLIAGLFACACLLAIGLDVPFAAAHATVVVWITPTVQAIAFCGFSLTAWMLVAQYRASGYAPFAILGCAFALTAAFRAAVFVCDPATLSGVWGGAGAESAIFLRLLARVAFYAIVAYYAYADWRERRTSGAKRANVTALWSAAVACFVAGVSIATLGRAHLPVLIDGRGSATTLYEHAVVPFMLACDAVSAALVLVAVKRRSRLRLWLFADLVAMACNTMARALGGAMYTNGFYLSCSFELIEATLFVFVVQLQIEETLRRAERASARAHALFETLAIADAQSSSGIGALLARVIEDLGFDYGALLHATGGELEVESTVGVSAFKKGQRLPLDGTVTRHALATREMVIVDDFGEPEWVERKINNSGLWKSACVMPLFSSEGTYGAVAFTNMRERTERLTPLDQEYLRVVGVMIGNAVERIGQKRRLDELAYYDALTGLPNRVLLIDRITAALALAERNEQKLAVHFLDLDDFKPVNDRFGHAVGDDVLRGVAKRLESTVRASDTIGRYGGDEFVVLQPVIEDARGVADIQARIATALREPIEVAAGSFKVSASIGVSVFPQDGRDAFTLVLRADEAQYRVKDARRAARANLLYDSGI